MAAINPRDDFLTFAEVSQEAEYYDDWLFSSTKRYKYISMYETDKAIVTAQWYGPHSQYICLGTGEISNNDILVYKLPDIVDDDAIDRLSKDREMSIVAVARCDTPSNSLVAAPNEFQDPYLMARCAAGSSKVFLHSVPHELSDSTISPIVQLCTFDLFDDAVQSPAMRLAARQLLICAGRLTEILWCDVTTGKKVDSCCAADSSLDEPVSGLLCSEDGNVCVMCGGRSGTMFVVDRRTPNSAVCLSTPALEKNKSWLACGQVGVDIVLVNNNNEISLYDTRNPGTAKLQSTVEAPPWTGRGRASNFTAELYDNYVSIAGKDNKVRIYNITQLKEGITTQPIFTHDGHLPDVQGGDMPFITTHSWNRTGKPRLLSSSNTGQLHTWMFAAGNG